MLSLINQSLSSWALQVARGKCDDTICLVCLELDQNAIGCFLTQYILRVGWLKVDIARLAGTRLAAFY